MRMAMSAIYAKQVTKVSIYMGEIIFSLQIESNRVGVFIRNIPKNM